LQPNLLSTLRFDTARGYDSQCPQAEGTMSFVPGREDLLA
jgi:hypothetical protein